MRRMRIIRNLDDDTSNYKRRLKSLTERILLIDTELIYGVYYNSIDLFDSISGVNCKILGSKNTTYNICISKENDNINCTCSCPDYVQRKEYCNLENLKIWNLSIGIINNMKNLLQNVGFLIIITKVAMIIVLYV